MNTRYNFYNLEASFRSYLIAENITPVTLKNYLSDYRHFMGWMEFYNRSHNVIPGDLPVISGGLPVIPSEVEGSSVRKDIDATLTQTVIEAYKSYLVENNIPLKSINRRLSTVRKFCSFCISQGWMKENPAKRVSNVSGSVSLDSSSSPQNDILNQFKPTVDHTIFSDVMEFVKFISS